MKNLVSVLFIRKDSIYKSLGVDAWDAERDALLWLGGNAIVAHPPCGHWGRFYRQCKQPETEKELGVFAVAQVRRYGGVLEHPKYSKLWKFCGLPIPGGGIDQYGGFTLCVNQSWFGHKAEKKTWLYIVGIPPAQIPVYPLNFSAVMYTISSSKASYKTGKKEVSHTEREATPILFANWLISVAELCKVSIPIT